MSSENCENNSCVSDFLVWPTFVKSVRELWIFVCSLKKSNKKALELLSLLKSLTHTHMVSDIWSSVISLLLGFGVLSKPQYKYDQSGRTTRKWQEHFFWHSRQTSCKRRPKLVKLIYPCSFPFCLSCSLSLSLNLYQSLFIPLLFLPPSHTLSHSSLPLFLSPSLTVSPSIKCFSFGWLLKLVCLV